MLNMFEYLAILSRETNVDGLKLYCSENRPTDYFCFLTDSRKLLLFQMRSCRKVEHLVRHQEVREQVSTNPLCLLKQK